MKPNTPYQLRIEYQIKMHNALKQLPEGVKPTVHGIGYNSEGLPTTFNGQQIKSYKLWSGMLERCYSLKRLERQRTYMSKTVCPEWFDYANFKRWYDRIEAEFSMTDYPLATLEIDSDLVPYVQACDDCVSYDYSPTTVLMLPRVVNATLSQINGNRDRPNKDLLTGITRNGKGYYYNTVKGSKQYGKSRMYATQELAHEALCREKAQRIELVMKPFYDNTRHVQHNLKYVYSYFTRWENIQKANILHRMAVNL